MENLGVDLEIVKVGIIFTVGLIIVSVWIFKQA
jgi:hypothetical protein